VSYYVLRDPAWRGVDFVLANRYWKTVWFTIALGPDMLQGPLRRIGAFEYRPVPVRLPSGVTMMLDPSDLVDQHLIADSAWEEEEWGWIRDNLQTNEMFVDIGAHHGTYSLRAARYLSAGEVIAFEPNPVALRRLHENIALNDIRNIQVREVAVGDREGTLTLFDASARNTGMASLSRQNAELSGGGGGVSSHEVAIAPLDKLLEGYSERRIGAIKVDTEGAETAVLRSAAGTIRKHLPALAIEVRAPMLANMGSSVAELERLLESYGYERVSANEVNSLWKPSVNAEVDDAGDPRP
jgi:FkbM family methyltransferase